MEKNSKKNASVPKQAMPSASSEQKEKKRRKPMSKKLRLTVWISAVAVFLIGAVLSGFFIYRANAEFHYLQADLSRYVTLSPEAIKNIKLSVTVDKPTQEDVDAEMLSLRVQYATLPKGAPNANDLIGYGSKVELYYIGYYLVDGERKYFSGGSNLIYAETGKTDLVTVGLTLADGGFIPGFSEGLIGIRPSDTEVPNVSTSGTLSEGDTVYVNLTGFHPNGKAISQTGIPLVLTPDLDEEYGAGFFEMLCGATVGEDLCSTKDPKIFSSTADGEGDFVYTKIFPHYKSQGGKSHTVEAYFPWSYSEESLQGKTAFYDVYIKNTTTQVLPELTDAFLTEKIANISEKLAEYEGDSLVEKYESFVWEALMEDYEVRLMEVAEESFWEKLAAVAEVKRVPFAARKKIYNEYIESLRSQYEEALDTMGYTESMYPFKTFCREFLTALPEGQSYKKYVRNLAKQTAGETMAFFYAIEIMGVAPNKEELKEAFEESLVSLAKKSNPLLDESIYEEESDPEKREEYYQTYLEEMEETKASLLNELGEEYFIESAYYNYGFPKLLALAKITYIGKGQNG